MRFKTDGRWLDKETNEGISGGYNDPANPGKFSEASRALVGNY